MLRGLDTGSPDEDPIVVKAAGRERLEGTVTAYLRTGVSSVVRDRQARVRETVERLEGSGVVTEVEVTGWPERARTPPDTDVEAGAVALYDEFVESVGAESLNPFFEERTGTGGDDRVLDLPAICVVYREDGELAGLYPRWSDGDHHSIEDGLRALCTGDRVANVGTA